jgi:hypothetical protein
MMTVEGNGMLRIAGVVVVLCGLTAAAMSQAGGVDRTGNNGNNNIFVGGTYNKATLVAGDKTTLYGWKAAGEKKFKTRWLSLAGEVSGGYGHHTYVGLAGPLCPSPLCGGTVEVRATEYDFLAGPRVSGNAGSLRIFGHVLFGAGHIIGTIKTPTPATNSTTAFAADIGGGVDYALRGPFAWRVQADYLQTQFYGTAQKDVRFSTGLVIRF